MELVAIRAKEAERRENDGGGGGLRKKEREDDTGVIEPGRPHVEPPRRLLFVPCI